MRQEFDNVSFLVGNKEILNQMKDVPALPIFSNIVREFLAALSDELLYNNHAKQFSDIIAYAFWIRSASIEKAYEKYVGETYRIGRGIAFQIAPSNIPVQFAVSMTYAILSGNMSVVRVSRKMFQQVDIICEAINRILRDDYLQLLPYICVLRYDHDDAVTQWLSDICDIRMIWGGDNTISMIRQIPIRSRCIELSFADRYSFAVIDSDDYLRSDLKIVATDFYNDTYYTDQNACSSSRLIIWTGSQIEKAKEVFWDSLKCEVERKYRLNEICGSEKLLKTAICAAEHPGIREIRHNNAIVRIELPELYDDIMDFRGNCGYFFEYDTNDLESIVSLLKNDCQTVTYFGKTLGADIRTLVYSHGVRGVDRIVPLGHSMDLSFVWDGYDLPVALSRVVGNT